MGGWGGVGGEERGGERGGEVVCVWGGGWVKRGRGGEKQEVGAGWERENTERVGLWKGWGWGHPLCPQLPMPISLPSSFPIVL